MPPLIALARTPSPPGPAGLACPPLVPVSDRDGAVRAPLVVEPPGVSIQPDPRMLPADARVVEHHVAVGCPADGGLLIEAPRLALRARFDEVAPRGSSRCG